MKRLWMLLSLLPVLTQAAVIGQMRPAEPLSEARIRAEAGAQAPAWLAYLARSRQRLQADQAVLAAERAGAGRAAPAAHAGRSGMVLNRPLVWYGSSEAVQIVKNILSFQTPAGGWGKNADRRAAPRLPGQHYIAADGDAQRESWHFVGTIDNDATTTELRFLARAQSLLSPELGAAARAAFGRGIAYLLESQYPNGGFPQVYPLEGSYHDAITLNDHAMMDVVELLADVAGAQGDFAFVAPDMAAACGQALDRAVALLLALQVQGGWAQQYDMLQKSPAGARNFEPAALAGAESARVLQWLMTRPAPGPLLQRAVHAAAAWLQKAALYDVAWVTGTNGHQLLAQSGAGPLWARLYDVETLQPVFGDRDRSIHDQVQALSRERREGYGWYGDWPRRVLEAYAQWARRYPQ